MKVCPDYGEKILKHFSDQHEAAYIILIPFLKFNEHDKKYFESIDWEIDRKIILNKTNPVTWKKIIELGQFIDIKQLNYALLSSISAINNEDEELSKRLIDFLEKHHYFGPPEGTFSDYSLNDIINVFKDENYESIILADEWYDEITEIRIKDLNIDVYNYEHVNIHSPDEKILFTVHWDSFFIIFAGPKDVISNYVEKYSFEGFWCTENTEILWYKDNCM